MKLSTFHWRKFSCIVQNSIFILLIEFSNSPNRGSSKFTYLVTFTLTCSHCRWNIFHIVATSGYEDKSTYCSNFINLKPEIRVSPTSTKSLDIPFCIRQTVDVAVIALIDSIFVTAEAASHTTLNWKVSPSVVFDNSKLNLRKFCRYPQRRRW